MVRNLNKIAVLPGKTFPLGATLMDGGVNFALYSKNSAALDLILFPSETVPELQILRLDPETHKTYSYWHAFIPGLRHGQTYGFRAHGPNDPSRGFRFDGRKLLLDPYAKAILGWEHFDPKAATKPGDNIDSALCSAVVDTSQYDWENDQAPRTPFAESVIYEMHVGGFTRNSNSGVAADRRGTFRGIIDKIPYLKKLGVTSIELMPVQEFDSQARGGRANYWGYSTIGFFAPHHGYCVGGDTISGVNEFRDMVKALHKEGIEVILDVVFNHTGEGDDDGPTLSFRGLENTTYYLLDANQSNTNFSGCGNSFNCNHSVVSRMIRDCLRYWVSEMHVDGFRFDLAAALSRDVFGNPMSLPPLLWSVETDPVLAGTKLIAEAWDAAGLYRVGWFVNTSNWYAEWNGPFRDDVRRFVRGDLNSTWALSERIGGSGDLYPSPDREPNRSINFIACHDGFTLHDLTAYNEKHNEENGESNRDGANDNFSWNCGVEGETSDTTIIELRTRQMKNLLTIMFVSQGTPMLLMGDEVGRTQHGNNNAYCQDSELTWFDWSLVNKNAALLRFVQNLIAYTQSLEVFRQRKPLPTVSQGDHPYIMWHGVKLGQPDWAIHSHSLAFTLGHDSAHECLHVMLNSYWEELEFELPALPKNGRWLRICDTSLAPPNDFQLPADAVKLDSASYTVAARSVVIVALQEY